MSEKLQELNRQLWNMTRKLTGMQIPYNPPPKNLQTMKENNPKGYSLLLQYLEKLEEYNKVKNDETQGSQENSN